MRIERLHHIAIICSDYERSRDFYTRILGLTVLHEVFREERESFKLDLKINGEYQIELFSFPHPPKRISGPEACGLRHLAFQVENVEKSKAELEGNGVLVEEIKKDLITGKKYTFFFDPDNLPLEIYEK